MSCSQLEFNIDDKTSLETCLRDMQRQIDAMHESMGKVRRNLFAQVGDLTKSCMEIREDVQKLKGVSKTQWIYEQDGESLFREAYG